MELLGSLLRTRAVSIDVMDDDVATNLFSNLIINYTRVNCTALLKKEFAYTVDIKYLIMTAEC